MWIAIYESNYSITGEKIVIYADTISELEEKLKALSKDININSLRIFKADEIKYSINFSVDIKLC